MRKQANVKRDVSYRIASPNDAGAIAKIYERYLGHGTMNLGPIDDRFEQQLAHQASAFVVAEQEAIIGWASVRPYSDRGGYVKACEISAFIENTFHGQGIGKALYHHVLHQADALKYHHVVARVWAQNKLSIKLHEATGFSLVGTQKEIGWINDKYVDVSIYQKLL